jgi:predicted dehydrogenase
MASTLLRIGIAGCGFAARVHLDRLLALEAVRVVGIADPDLATAEAMAACVPTQGGEASTAFYSDHRDLLRNHAPDALAIFTPHVAHYRPAMDALQAGCHVFIEKPLSTSTQEAVDIVGLARGRNRKVGVGHQYRLRPSLIEARARLAAGEIGTLRLVTATIAEPWLDAHGGAENLWRFDPKAADGGILADAGDHLIDALLWTTGQTAVEVASVQNRLPSGLDLVTAAAVRLADGTLATFAFSGTSPGSLFELHYFGEKGRMRVTEVGLELETSGSGPRELPLATTEAAESIDGNFVSAVVSDAPLCCPAEQALDSVRLLEAIARSAATGQVVRLA